MRNNVKSFLIIADTRQLSRTKNNRCSFEGVILKGEAVWLTVGVRVSGIKGSHCKAHVTNMLRSSERIRHHLPREKKLEARGKCFIRLKPSQNIEIRLFLPDWNFTVRKTMNVYGSVYPGTHTGNRSVFSTFPCLQSTPVVPIYTLTARSAITLT